MIAFCGVFCWDGFIECVGDGGGGGEILLMLVEGLL